MAIAAFKPQFVRAIPEQIEEGVIYVSMEFRTAMHKCACGCGRNVITPFGPAQWKLIYDGRVWLHPSIGNWNFPCRSHYWVRGNVVAWAEQWSDARVAAASARERENIESYYGAPSTPTIAPAPKGFWARLRRAFAVRSPS
ncbi:MAG: DUF6527 family protein [Xanthobacteraceae bacterium]